MIAAKASPVLVAERVMRRSLSRKSSKHGLSSAVFTRLIAQIARKDLARPPRKVVEAHRDTICAALAAPKLVSVDGALTMRPGPQISLADKALELAVVAARRVIFGHVFDAIALSVPQQYRARQHWPKAAEYTFGRLIDIRSDDEVIAAYWGKKCLEERCAQCALGECKGWQSTARPFEVRLLSVRWELSSPSLGVASAEEISLRELSKLCRQELKAALRRRQAAELAASMGDELWAAPDDAVGSPHLTELASKNDVFDGQARSSEGTREELLRDAQDFALGTGADAYSTWTWGDGWGDLPQVVKAASDHVFAVNAQKLAAAAEGMKNPANGSAWADQREAGQILRARAEAIAARIAASRAFAGYGSGALIQRVRDDLDTEFGRGRASILKGACALDGYENDPLLSQDAISDRTIELIVRQARQTEVEKTVNEGIDRMLGAVRDPRCSADFVNIAISVNAELSRDPLVSRFANDKRMNFEDPVTGIPLLPVKPAHVKARFNRAQ